MSTKSAGISREESEVYDRQIRLWGLEAQNRLRNANVLLVGLGGLGAEVAKNLMLSGLKSLTLMDDKGISSEDFASNFLLKEHSVGENRAQASKVETQSLNPMVELRVSEEDVDSKQADFFQQFDIVILTDRKYDCICRVNKICRLHNIKFLAGGVFGWCGYSFSDFDKQTFLVPKPKKCAETVLSDSDDAEEDDGEPVGKRFKKDGGWCKQVEKPAITLEDDDDIKVPQKANFPSFEHAMNMDFTSKKMLRASRSGVPASYFPVRALLRTLNECDDCTAEEFEKRWTDEVSNAKGMGEAARHPSTDEFKFYLGPQLAPVCAIVGGVIGQEAIKAISQDGTPFKNFFLYSALDTTGIVCDLPLAA